MSATAIRVALGQRAYDIVVGDGLLAQAAPFVRPHLPRPWTVVVTDRNVARWHLPVLRRALGDAGIATEAVVVAPGEASKSFAELEALVEALLAHKVERNDVILALGGGVIGDLAGFAAAILRRGVKYIQVPTTLLAQVDSSVGGKTGINSRHGKNLIGSFHQPRAVIADVATLATLPARERRAGYAEIVKYSLIGDAPFFAWLEANGPAVIDGDRAAQIYAVTASCRHKARIVAADEREQGERALLNLGHTFGHALEGQAGYGDRLVHGEAVAIGLVLAFELSARLKFCPPGDVERLRRHLAAVGLPTAPGDADDVGFDAATLYQHMEQDKKVAQGRMTFILARGIGAAFVCHDVPASAVMELLTQAVAAPRRLSQVGES